MNPQLGDAFWWTRRVKPPWETWYGLSLGVFCYIKTHLLKMTKFVTLDCRKISIALERSASSVVVTYLSQTNLSIAGGTFFVLNTGATDPTIRRATHAAGKAPFPKELARIELHVVDTIWTMHGWRRLSHGIGIFFFGQKVIKGYIFNRFIVHFKFELKQYQVNAQKGERVTNKKANK